MQYQKTYESDRRELVRKFSDKWNQEEPDSMLALGVAVVSNGPENPAKQKKTFRALYQESDGDALV